MKKINSKIFLLLIILFSITSCSEESDPVGQDNEVEMPEVELTERELALMAYHENYLGSEVIDLGWTGNTALCDAGTVPQSVHDLVAQRISYFRQLVGLNPITLDASQFIKYQETALLMKANNSLSHYPPDTWLCWSQEAADGAADSNIAAMHSTDAITAFIEDRGQNNKPVAHRRWILHSTKTEFSYGTTNSTMALAVLGVAGGNTQIPPYVAYPPNGYIPGPLVFPRWSFGLPKADFSSATVTMNGPDGNIELDVIYNEFNAFSFIGDNTIVWEPQGIISNSSIDRSYTVLISGVQNAPQTSYTYDVTIIEP